MTQNQEIISPFSVVTALCCVSPAAVFDSSPASPHDGALTPSLSPGACTRGSGSGRFSYLPPEGNTGGILPSPLKQLSSVEVGIDWITCSLHKEKFHDVFEHLTNTFGTGEESPGGKFYRIAVCFPLGVRLMAENRSPDDADSICVEIPGAGCSALEADERLSLMHFFAMHDAKFTRVDVAIDFRGREITLLDSCIAACEADTLCHAATFTIHRKQTTRKGLKGLTLTIGARGKDGSGRQVCIYDKGLESGTLQANEWVRWESRFYKVGGVADRVADFLLFPSSLGRDCWRAVAFGLALGAIDFREPGTRLDRRNRCGWWETWVRCTAPVVVKAERSEGTLDGFLHWAEKCVAPTFRRFDHEKKAPPGTVFARFFKHVEPKAVDTATIREFVRSRCKPKEVPIGHDVQHCFNL